MKLFFQIAGGAILFILVGLLFSGRQVREIRSQIVIAAPPAAIWENLVQLDQWSEWNPTVKESQGEVVEGGGLKIIMMGDEGKDGPSYAPTVIEVKPERLLHWKAVMGAGFLFTNQKVFELTPIEGGGTELVHKELFSGMMVPLFWDKFKGHVPPLLESMNTALKERAETKD